jgi:hypothetical protein
LNTNNGVNGGKIVEVCLHLILLIFFFEHPRLRLGEALPCTVSPTFINYSNRLTFILSRRLVFVVAYV